MIKINITSDKVHSGKTTLAVELAKFLSERTGESVTIISDSSSEALNERYILDNELKGLDIEIVDLNGNTEEMFKSLAVTSYFTTGESK